MRPEPHEDASLNDGPSPIESRLKQLQPRSANLVAADLMAAALRAERQVSHKVSGHESGQVSRHELTAADRRGRPRWFALAGASVCGAVVGTLVTCIVLWPRLSPATPTNYPNANSANANSGRAARPELVIVNDQRPPTKDPEDQVDDSASPKLEHVEPSITRPGGAPKWSRTERLVSSRMLEVGVPNFGDPPLMAGHYARLEVFPARYSQARYSVGVPGSATPQGGPDATPESPTKLRSTPSGHLRPLLRELLGNRQT